MKIQDILFFIVLLIIFLLKRPRFFVYAGLASLVLAIPLFATWTFFTAERLTLYAAVFFLCFVLFNSQKDK